MKEFVLYLSLALNIVVAALGGWFAYQVDTKVRSMSSSSPVYAPVTISEIIEFNDGGYKARFYILDKSGDRVVAEEYPGSPPAHKVGDAVKLRMVKMSIGGRDRVNYDLER